MFLFLDLSQLLHYIPHIFYVLYIYPEFKVIR